jgi:hypothetical protein
MQTIYILFEANQWLSNDSKKLRAVFSTLKKAVKNAQIISTQEDEKLSEDEIRFLELNFQTQGRELNFIIEKHEVR